MCKRACDAHKACHSSHAIHHRAQRAQQGAIYASVEKCGQHPEHQTDKRTRQQSRKNLHVGEHRFMSRHQRPRRQQHRGQRYDYSYGAYRAVHYCNIAMPAQRREGVLPTLEGRRPPGLLPLPWLRRGVKGSIISSRRSSQDSSSSSCGACSPRLSLGRFFFMA